MSYVEWLGQAYGQMAVCLEVNERERPLVMASLPPYHTEIQLDRFLWILANWSDPQTFIKVNVKY